MSSSPKSWLDRAILFCLHNKLIVFLLVLFCIGWGLYVAPFDWKIAGITRSPVPVDAIPNLGENQQIVFTQWSGRSPRDVEEQITYPLTSALLGVPGVKTVRSYSYFGFSTIYLIFKEDVEFYWSRSRVLEKLNSLAPGVLPARVNPSLGPDATALGQIFWYTLEGRDQKGKTASGWDTYELRKIQDWYVRYALQSVSGVSAVASIGGFQPQYQIDADPEKLRIHRISLQELYQAIRRSNQEIGARTIEINRVEYMVRARGYIKSIRDLEQVVIKATKGAPITIRDVATVTLGPAPRRGALDKDGAEVVGGVVIARHGANPLEVIQAVKQKIKEISKGLPKKRLKDGRQAQIKVIPFYDRTHLIKETLSTLNEAITLEILVTILVVMGLLLHVRSSLLISGMLPLSVLLCFIAMRYTGIDANIVALSGIAIAIGTMVDMGVVLSENMIQALEQADPEQSSLDIIYQATSEVGSAVLTAVSTTVVSFLPVLTMEASEGKLFRPLAFTKTFALLASLGVSLFVLPPLAHLIFPRRKRRSPRFWISILFLSTPFVFHLFQWSLPWETTSRLVLIGLGLFGLFHHIILWLFQERGEIWMKRLVNLSAIVLAGFLLSTQWMPLGFAKGLFLNLLFVVILVGGTLIFFQIFLRYYEALLCFVLAHKALFLVLPLMLVLTGGTIWLGFGRIFGWIPRASQLVGFKEATIRKNSLWQYLHNDAFPGLKKEFMPDLDEGSFLLMPTTMPHASIGETLAVLKKIDISIRNIPEVSGVVGKIGRASTALDPAPISMIESVIHYKPEYRREKNGTKVRQWRKHIRSPKDIWNEIVKVTKIPGTTSAPFLQPISARLVMLQSGMRAPMGIKIKGPDLKTIEKVGIAIEKLLKQVPQIAPATVLADRVVGKPYLEFVIDRRAIARYGLPLSRVHSAIQMAIGGRVVTTTIEGRERYEVVVRYPRELRTDLQSLQNITVANHKGVQIPLSHLASLQYTRGPQMIKSEDTFLVSYVVFDKKDRFGEIEAVNAAKTWLESKIKSGELKLPSGVSYRFSGSYESQIRAEKKLAIVLPIALLFIFLILYLQFRSTWTTSFIFVGVLVAWAGGFLMIWLYAQPWFLNFSIVGLSMRDVFHVQPLNLSVAVWVGFIALFGIATDDGVVMATYLDQAFKDHEPESVEEVRQAVLEAGCRRIRPCLMTTATTILALLPILTSSGKGSDVMVPMAIPSFGGMTIEILTLFIVPTLYCWRKEVVIRRMQKGKEAS